MADSNEDRIQPYARNRYYWQYRGRPVLLIGGSKEDNLFQIPDLEDHLNEMVRVGANVIRNTMSDRDEGNIPAYRRLPDGRFDLNQWNDQYWRRFETMLRLTHEGEIFVQIEVWDRLDYTDAKGLWNWRRHPYNPANNVNYTYKETGFAESYPDHPALDRHPFFHTVPGVPQYQPKYDRIRAFQERFVEKMLSCSLDYGHVLYCMNNETSTHEAWGQYWMEFIPRKAAEKGARVFVTDMFDDVWYPEKSARLPQAIEQPELYDFLDIS